ncbi:SAM hydrolase/SAM-dependent halogenase family protein [Rohdeia mirabilis]|uniref:SAM hydrolase/SAM-dependent halogenase family protein n=1 Tax=Rohdeia mirabilis TaxID=2528008 RepID=UPI003AF3AF4F
MTLLTDFGSRDAYVGCMKGVLLSRAPSLRSIVDLTHDVPAQDTRAATFHLRHAWAWFPTGTVHVAVVDPGVGTERAILVARHEGHFFLAPDNGLLAPILEPTDAVHALDVTHYPAPSATFHGRDLFAPAAARLVEGATLEELGPGLRPGQWIGATEPGPRIEADRIAGRVEHVDRFGNLILDVPGAALGVDTGDWVVEIQGVRVDFAPTYGSAGVGALLALVDSYDRVEIAERGGDASSRLDVGRGTPVTLLRAGATRRQP